MSSEGRRRSLSRLKPWSAQRQRLPRHPRQQPKFGPKSREIAHSMSGRCYHLPATDLQHPECHAPPLCRQPRHHIRRRQQHHRLCHLRCRLPCLPIHRRQTGHLDRDQDDRLSQQWCRSESLHLQCLCHATANQLCTQRGNQPYHLFLHLGHRLMSHPLLCLYTRHILRLPPRQHRQQQRIPDLPKPPFAASKIHRLLLQSLPRDAQRRHRHQLPRHKQAVSSRHLALCTCTVQGLCIPESY